jgi:hypothetical protein
MTQEKKRNDKDNLVDEVGETNIYPVSEMEGASDDAKVHGEKSFGQGERGAKGYEDSGTSETIRDEEIKQNDKK